MTKINASIEPKKLCDQHLLAEHRRIKRLTNLVNSKSELPSGFRSGSGHVLWFKYRLGFAKNRCMKSLKECLIRGFNPVIILIIGITYLKNTPMLGNLRMKTIN